MREWTPVGNEKCVHQTKCLDLQSPEANPKKDAVSCFTSTEGSSPLLVGERTDFSRNS